MSVCVRVFPTDRAHTYTHSQATTKQTPFLTDRPIDRNKSKHTHLSTHMSGILLVLAAVVNVCASLFADEPIVVGGTATAAASSSRHVHVCSLYLGEVGIIHARTHAHTCVHTSDSTRRRRLAFDIFIPFAFLFFPSSPLNKKQQGRRRQRAALLPAAHCHHGTSRSRRGRRKQGASRGGVWDVQSVKKETQKREKTGAKKEMVCVWKGCSCKYICVCACVRFISGARQKKPRGSNQTERKKTESKSQDRFFVSFPFVLVASFSFSSFSLVGCGFIYFPLSFFLYSFSFSLVFGSTPYTIDRATPHNHHTSLLSTCQSPFSFPYRLGLLTISAARPIPMPFCAFLFVHRFIRFPCHCFSLSPLSLLNVTLAPLFPCSHRMPPTQPPQKT